METGSNVSSGEFVSMVCTWSECTVGGQMHKECYDKQEKELLSLLMRSSKTIGQGEMKKAMWTHKYDMVRPQCRCACSKGYFKPVAGEKRGSHVIDPPPLAASILKFAVPSGVLDPGHFVLRTSFFGSSNNLINQVVVTRLIELLFSLR